MRRKGSKLLSKCKNITLKTDKNSTTWSSLMVLLTFISVKGFKFFSFFFCFLELLSHQPNQTFFNDVSNKRPFWQKTCLLEGRHLKEGAYNYLFQILGKVFIRGRHLKRPCIICGFTKSSFLKISKISRAGQFIEQRTTLYNKDNVSGKVGDSRKNNL